jgi:hypothetical protein
MHIRKIALPLAAAATVGLGAALTVSAPAGASTAQATGTTCQSASSAYGVELFTSTTTDASATWTSTSTDTSSCAAVALTINDSAGYGGVIVTNTAAGVPTVAPSMTVTDYASGTPRYYVFTPQFNDTGTGDYALAYPDPSTGCTSADPDSNGLCWFENNSTPATWSDVRTFINDNGGLGQAGIIADSSQTTPYTSDVTAMSWDGQALLPGVAVTPPATTWYWHHAGRGYFTNKGKKASHASGDVKIGSKTYYWHSAKKYLTLNGKKSDPASGAATWVS